MKKNILIVLAFLAALSQNVIVIAGTIAVMLFAIKDKLELKKVFAPLLIGITFLALSYSFSLIINPIISFINVSGGSAIFFVDFLKVTNAVIYLLLIVFLIIGAIFYLFNKDIPIFDSFARFILEGKHKRDIIIG